MSDLVPDLNDTAAVAALAPEQPRVTLPTIEPDYSKAWVKGDEHIAQEGTSFWRELRESRGWSREDVYDLTDYQLDPATQALIEGDYGIGLVWELEQLVTLAHLYGRKPGELLDECLEQAGERLKAEEAEEAAER